MDDRYAYELVHLGMILADDQVTRFKLPSVPAALRGAKSAGGLANTGYIDARYGLNDSIVLTFNDVQVAVAKGTGSTGYAGLKVLDLPAGVYKLLGVVPSLVGAVTAGWAPTSPVMSVGSATAGNGDATLTTTEADIVASTALTISSDAFGFAPDDTGPLAALTDSSGGTASTTLASIAAGASYAQADMTAAKNAIASLAAQVESLRQASLGNCTINATAAAKAVYLNFACNSDPSVPKTITLSGTLRLRAINLGDN